MELSKKKINSLKETKNSNNESQKLTDTKSMKPGFFDDIEKKDITIRMFIHK